MNRADQVIATLHKTDLSVWDAAVKIIGEEKAGVIVLGLIILIFWGIEILLWPSKKD